MIKVLAFDYEDKNLPEAYAEVYEQENPWKILTLEGKLLGEMVVIKTKDNHRLVIYTGDIPTSQLNIIQDYPSRERWHSDIKDTYNEVVEKTANCHQVNWNIYNKIIAKV